MKRDHLSEIFDQVRRLEVLDQRIKNLHWIGKSEALEVIAELVHRHRLTPRELRWALYSPGMALQLARRARAGIYKVAPKYRNPHSGATWTGRGRPPRWLVAAEAEGADRESFLISGQAKWAANPVDQSVAPSD